MVFPVEAKQKFWSLFGSELRDVDDGWASGAAHPDVAVDGDVGDLQVVPASSFVQHAVIGRTAKGKVIGKSKRPAGERQRQGETEGPKLGNNIVG